MMMAVGYIISGRKHMIDSVVLTGSDAEVDGVLDEARGERRLPPDDGGGGGGMPDITINNPIDSASKVCFSISPWLVLLSEQSPVVSRSPPSLMQ